jgi:TamB, inner membrane protein subunit of TAM complex
LLLAGIVLSLPAVQTKFAQHFTNQINEQYGTNINIDKVAINIFSGVKLKGVYIKDYKKDTLIFVKIIKTNILDINKLIDGDLLFGDLRLDGLLVNMKTYKSEKDSNLDKFIDAFDDGKKSEKPFLMQAKRVYITNSRYILTDENRVVPKDLDIKKLNTTFENFKISGPNVNLEIKKMSFLDHRGVFVKNITSVFSYTKKNIKLENLNFATNESIFIGEINMNYDRADFADFNNKVKFDVKIDLANFATNDIKHFYNEIGNDNIINIRSNIKGTLNDLYLFNLLLNDKNNETKMIGDISLKNMFGKIGKEFKLSGNFKEVRTNYDDLVLLLPNILGKSLPISLKKLGTIVINGKSEISAKNFQTVSRFNTSLGSGTADLKMFNLDSIDTATYIGNIVLNNFEIGKLLNKTNFGKVSLNIDVDGKGFTKKNIKTEFTGTISHFFYNGYNYSNIDLNGNLKQPIYNGQISINDPNLKMDFYGILDLSKNINHYDIDTKIEFANLKKLNFIKDSLSNFKGRIKTNVKGNSIDNLAGNIKFTNTSYINKKGVYQFDDFEINSSFDENNIRTITLNSPDIIEGKIVGKFKFELLQKMVENSIGSLYANYKSNSIQKGQFLSYDFKIYNKIIEIFYPGIEIGTNTKINGSMSSDNDDFKFNFNSPKIVAYDNYFDNINIKIDNKNPLYNAYIEMDSIKTKNYKIRDFSLINLTVKDTLYLRSEFKGGNKGEDIYNLNLYHTIDKNNKNVVGIKKSEVKFKNNLWYLNENETKDNKVVFDKLFKDFSIENLVMSHENEQINLSGNLNGKTTKDLKLNFKNVDLLKITPVLEKFKFEGMLNGTVNLKQNNSIYQPTSSLKINQLAINDKLLGDMDLDIIGDENFKNFKINSTIINQNLKSFNAIGKLEINDTETLIDLDLDFEKFNLGILSAVGGSTISNINGFATGKARINGNVEDFDMNGLLFVDGAGLKIPYLNTEYNIKDGSSVEVTRNRFSFNNITISDKKYNTNGILNGNIIHKNFGDWQLNLDISSRNLIALDTQDTEDAAYFGKAFIDGQAKIFGSTDALTINVDAKSNKGTDIKIPVNDSDGERDDNYIHFITKKEKDNIKNGVIELKNYDGLTLNFDLNITPDAEIEVILNRESKHGMKGTGYGTLQLAINTLGKFVMNGDFTIWNGKYNFKYGGLIDKTFDAKRGGTIIWSGDPLKADLNIEASYNKLNANPGVLLENPSFNKQVPVALTIGITGNLSRPESDFYIDFPTVSNVLKSEIQTKLEDKQIRQKQALVLLGSGSFLSQEGLNQSTLAYNNLFEKAGHLFDDLFQDEDSKIKMAINYNQADRSTTGTPTIGRVDVNFTTQVNEKISINGKVGVPVGGVNESVVVGNLEFTYKVNADGTMNLKVYNRENEINYIGEGIGYTQGLGISYEVDFDKFSELVYKIFKKKIAKSNIQQKPDKPKNNSNIDIKVEGLVPEDKNKKN